MNYFFLEPYVAGGIGENSVIETPGPRPAISLMDDFENEYLTAYGISNS